MNNKAQLLVVGVFLFFITSVTYGFIQLEEKQSISTYGFSVKVGQYQAGISEALHSAELREYTTRQAWEIASSKAVDRLRKNSGRLQPSAGGPGGAFTIDPPCGTFVYPKWSTEKKFCPPPRNQREAFGSEVLSLTNGYLTGASEFSAGITPALDVEQTDQGFTLTAANATHSLPIHLKREISDSFGSELLKRGQYAWPTDSKRISSCYGWRTLHVAEGEEGQEDYHDGIDIAVPTGTPVQSIKKGVVKTTCTGMQCSLADDSCDQSKQCGGYGNYVLIRHPDGTHSRYNHLQEVRVSEEEAVGKRTVLGLSGNTGYSGGPHLDLKFYPGDNTSAESGSPPLCLYDTEFLDRLTSGAESCEKYGRPPNFSLRKSGMYGDQCDVLGKNTVRPTDIPDDPRSFLSSARDAPEQYVRSRVGVYNHSLTMSGSFETGLSLTGDKFYGGVVDWAEATWNRCRKESVSCLRERMEQFNEESSSYKVGRRCEANTAYYRVLESFNACLENRYHGCVCEEELPPATGEFTITFHDDTITWEEGGADTALTDLATGDRFMQYSFDTNTSYYSNIPSDSVADPWDWIQLHHTGERYILNTTFGTREIETVRWYKPEKDKIVLIGINDGTPTCGQSQRNFLMCAKPDNTSKDTLRFALELRDTRPEPAESASTTTQEQSMEGKASQIKDKILEAGLSIALGPAVSSLILESLPESQPARVSATVSIPKDADIAALEAYCNVGTPLDSLSVERSQGVATFDNPYTDEVDTGSQHPLHASQDALQKAGAKESCRYVEVSEADGERVYRKRIPATRDGGEVTFSMNSCGDSPLQQFASKATRYCYTFVPIDKSGKRNPDGSVTTCTSLANLTTRVLEHWGLGQAGEYVSMAQDASSAVDALRDEGIDGLVKASKQGQKLQDAASHLRSEIARRSLEDAAVNARDELTDAVVDSIDDQQRAKAARRLLEGEASAREIVREHVLDKATEEEMREQLKQVSQRYRDMRTSARERIDAVYTEVSETLSAEAKREIIQQLQSESERLREDVNRLLEQNSEDGLRRRLTSEQVDRIFNDIITGEYGFTPREKAIEMLHDKVASVEDLYREVMGTDVAATKQALVDYAENAKREVKNELLRRVAVTEEGAEQMLETVSAEYTEIFYNLRQQAPRSVEEALERTHASLFTIDKCPVTLDA